MRQIMHYDAEFRREEATSAVGSHAIHKYPFRVQAFLPEWDMPSGIDGAG